MANFFCSSLVYLSSSDWLICSKSASSTTACSGVKYLGVLISSGLIWVCPLPRHADVDASHISNIENRKKHMGLDLLVRIADAFGVEPYEMIREYDPSRIGLAEKLGMIQDLHPIKQQAIEQMINAFLREKQMESGE